MVRPRQISDEDILEVARDCFLELGPGVSTTVIADRLGVSQAALFKRFGTKNQLMISALTPPADPPMFQLMRRGPDPDVDLWDQLEAIGLAMASFFEQLVPCMMALKASGVDLKEMLKSHYEIPPPVAGQRALAGWFSRGVAQGRIHEGDPDALAMHFLGALNVRAFLSHMLGDTVPGGTHAEYVRHLVTVIRKGVEA